MTIGSKILGPILDYRATQTVKSYAASSKARSASCASPALISSILLNLLSASEEQAVTLRSKKKIKHSHRVEIKSRKEGVVFVGYPIKDEGVFNSKCIKEGAVLRRYY